LGVHGFHILDRVLHSPMDELLLFLLTLPISVGSVVCFMFLFIFLTMWPFKRVILTAELLLYSSRTSPHPFLPTFFLSFIDIFPNMFLLYSPPHPGSPTLFPGQFVWDLWMTMWNCDRFSPRTLIFTCQHFYTSATYLYSTLLPIMIYNHGNGSGVEIKHLRS
jgi:hypothetical protein